MMQLTSLYIPGGRGCQRQTDGEHNGQNAKLKDNALISFQPLDYN
jgi:hypothetical protein